MNYPNKDIIIASLIAASQIAFNSAYAQSQQSDTDELEAQLQVTAAGSQSANSGSSPEIRVRQAGTTTVKEYHQQGKVYKVEIAPKNTPAYILSDQDGNGNLNSSDTSIDNDLVVPEWTIGNW